MTNLRKSVGAVVGAFALVATPLAQAQISQPSVSSSDQTITYGQAFTPPYYGGAGTGNWQFVIGGHTNWNPYPNGPAGTDIPGSGWAASWTPPGVGTYGFYIAKCGDNTYSNSNFAGWYWLTVNKAPMSTPTATASSYTIPVGQSWSGPGMTAPASNGTGPLLWCAQGGNNWTAGSWTPETAGTYDLYVAQKADANHYGNNQDPIHGDIQINFSKYTLVVTKLNQSTVSISPASQSVSSGATLTFTASGGSGSGSYAWGGAASGNGSSTNVTFNSPGNYSVTVYRQGDGSYNASNTATANITVTTAIYSLTVNSGSGSGNYASGANVSINANSPSYGSVFNYWSQSGPGSLSDSNWHSTQFTMGSGHATLWANYRVVNFGWGSTPTSVPNGQTYNVSVGVDSGGFPYVQLYKNGAYFAGGWFGTQGSTSDTGPQTVNYTANFSDSMKPSSGSSSRSVQITVPPSAQLNGPTTGVVDANNAYTLSNISNTSNWRWEVDLPPSAGYDWFGSYGASNPHNWAFGSGPGTYKFRAHLSGPGGYAYTNEITVTVTAGSPSITSHPSSQTVNPGTNVTFNVSAAGASPLSYQWRKNGTNIPGATSTSLTLTNVQPADAATYTCYVSNAYGNATSNGATLTVNVPPTISSHPQSQTVAVGANVSFFVSATGTAPLSYQWRKNGVNISGATNSTYSITNVQTSHAGNYGVVVTNSAGSATSSIAVLTIASPGSDTDGDGVPNGIESTMGTNPSNTGVSDSSNTTIGLEIH